MRKLICTLMMAPMLLTLACSPVQSGRKKSDASSGTGGETGATTADAVVFTTGETTGGETTGGETTGGETTGGETTGGETTGGETTGGETTGGETTGGETTGGETTGGETTGGETTGGETTGECVSNCVNKACGPDGCDGDCGVCGAGSTCDLNFFECIPDCVPQCLGKSCGDDGCAGECGVCDGNQTCKNGNCITECVPNCTNKDCGDDGCGGDCGPCPQGSTCDEVLQECKSDCLANCINKVCGDDGCGGSCGLCGLGQTCQAGGCADDCTPSCGNKKCGDNGCGGSCGSCSGGEVCAGGQCNPLPVGDGDTCGAPFVVTALPFSASGDTSGAAADYFYGAGDCPGETTSWGEASADHVYQFVPDETDDYTITLAGEVFDSNLYVVLDCDAIGTSCVGADEDVCSSCTEELTVTLQAGVPAYIIVDGYSNISNEAGSYVLSVNAASGCTPDCGFNECGSDGCGSGSCGTCGIGQTCTAGFCFDGDIKGDTCADAIAVVGVPFEATGDTTSAGNDYSYLAGSCPGEDGGHGAASGDVVYEFTALEAGDYIISLVPQGWDSTLYVTTDCEAIDTSCLAGTDSFCDDCTETLTVTLAFFQSVHIVVDGWSDIANEAGAYTISIDKAPPAPPDGAVIINEVLADPDPDMVQGDANCDGVRDSGHDEFVELVNASNQMVNLSGATLSDTVGVRHTFPDGSTLQPGDVLVVFGGGAPYTGDSGAAWCTEMSNAKWQLASTGALGLNNGGDTVVIAAATPLASLSFGDSGPASDKDVSLVRSPEVTGEFVLHDSVPGAIGPQSPGMTAVGGKINP